MIYEYQTEVRHGSSPAETHRVIAKKPNDKSPDVTYTLPGFLEYYSVLLIAKTVFIQAVQLVSKEVVT